MCDDLEIKTLAARATKDDPTAKEAKRINKQRSKRTQITTKKKRKDGDGVEEYADGLDGIEAKMTDA